MDKGLAVIIVIGFADDSQHACDLDKLSYAQYVDNFTSLSNDILPKVDVASMCHGLEVRLALLDVHMIESAAKTRPDVRYRTDPAKSEPVQKYALMKIVEKEFGPELAHRRKRGFGIPLVQWMKHPIWLDMIRRLLLDQNAPINQILNHQVIKEYVQRVDRGNGGQLWTLLMLGMWMDLNRDVSVM